MKKLLMAIAAAAMLLSCGKEEPKVTVSMSEPEAMQKKVITFTFGDAMSIHPMTRATLTEMNLTDLWVFDYVDGQLITDCHQLSTDDDFGSPSLSMEYGTHTLYFVASRGVNPTVSTEDKTITWQSVRDTFGATLQMTVEPSTGGTQTVILNRVAGKLKISVTDVVPDGAAKFLVTPSTWYYGLRYDTGDAVSSQNTPISVNIPNSYIGTTNLVVNVFTISGQTTWNTNITATLKASDNSTLGSVSIADVPIQRNHITSYSGGILSTDRRLSVSCDDEWIEDDAVTW